MELSTTGTPSRLRRPEAKAETRRRVLEAAESVFRRDGYHGASLDRIAAEAGFTKGAVYSTFDSKADVMLTLIAERAGRTQEKWANALADDATVEQFASRIADMGGERVAAERDWWAVVIEFMTVVSRDAELRDRFAEHHEATRDAIEASIRAWMERTGERALIPPRRLATVMIAFGNGLTVEGLIAPSEVPENLFADAVRLLHRGAYTTDPSEGEDR